MESSWNDVPGGQTPTYCEAAPFTGSVEDALEFEGFKTPDEGYDTKMAPVLFCPAYASHNAFLAPHSLKTIIIKNLILMFQALCIFQEVWPPLSEREIEVREAYHGLEKQLCRIFDAVFKDPGQGWKKPGSIAPIIIGMYTKARRDERDSWGDNGSPPMASDREIALLHQLVDEWIRFSDTHVPLHPVNHNNDGDRTQLAQLRRVQLEYYVCDKFNISPLFSGMWPWIDEKKRSMWRASCCHRTPRERHIKLMHPFLRAAYRTTSAHQRSFHEAATDDQEDPESEDEEEPHADNRTGSGEICGSVGRARQCCRCGWTSL